MARLPHAEWLHYYRELVHLVKQAAPEGVEAGRRNRGTADRGGGGGATPAEAKWRRQQEAKAYWQTLAGNWTGLQGNRVDAAVLKIMPHPKSTTSGR